ncbi:hypothetical protein Y032_0011g1424 [Ancylostoma ceylanicum]|uniref:Uncharacterized protein n=1 Tax=Ancylostoma ceylanicum TaxID=53326 RepID=A0A016VDV9_9BILA|nr:hypothetical protein Y032_0011g1424 [Ancylostoma ceylanicum]
MDGCLCLQSSFPSHSGLGPGNSAIFCKRAEVLARSTIFLVGFVKVDDCVCLHCRAKPRNSVKSVKAEFPWVLPLNQSSRDELTTTPSSDLPISC